MGFHAFSDSLFKQAEYRLTVARRAFDDAQYAYVICLSQEVVELALKSLLRRVGVAYPKSRDVGELLLINRDLFNRTAEAELDEATSISTELSRLKDFAAYGDEATAVPSENLFERSDAEDALRKAERILALVKKALS